MGAFNVTQNGFPDKVRITILRQKVFAKFMDFFLRVPCVVIKEKKSLKRFSFVLDSGFH